MLLLLLQVGCLGVTKQRASELLRILNGLQGAQLPMNVQIDTRLRCGYQIRLGLETHFSLSFWKNSFTVIVQPCSVRSIIHQKKQWRSAPYVAGAIPPIGKTHTFNTVAHCVQHCLSLCHSWCFYC
jgi:hypothetical protein